MPTKMEEQLHNDIVVLRMRLREAAHALKIHEGLWATSDPNAYDDALRDGLDANAAHDVVMEETFQINETTVLKHIEEALSATQPQPPIWPLTHDS